MAEYTISTSINKLVSKFHHGARANLYRVEVSYLGEDLEFFCRSAQFPGHSIDKVPVYYLNNKIYVAGDNEFTDWTLTIINDKTFTIRNNLELWSDSIKAKYGTYGATDIKEYMKTAYIYQIDENGNEIRCIKLLHAWPNEISPIEVSYDTQDTFQEYSITMSYAYYEEEKGFATVVKDAASDMKLSIKSSIGDLKDTVKKSLSLDDSIKKMKSLIKF